MNTGTKRNPLEIDTKIRKIPKEDWEAFKDAARFEGKSVNKLLLELISAKAKKWNAGDKERTIKKAMDYQQGKLL